MVLERDGTGDELPHEPTERGHPLGAEHHVVPCKRHNKEVDQEGNVIEWGPPDDTKAGNLLAVGYGRREPGSGLDS